MCKHYLLLKRRDPENIQLVCHRDTYTCARVAFTHEGVHFTCAHITCACVNVCLRTIYMLYVYTVFLWRGSTLKQELYVKNPMGAAFCQIENEFKQELFWKQKKVGARFKKLNWVIISEILVHSSGLDPVRGGSREFRAQMLHHCTTLSAIN